MQTKLTVIVYSVRNNFTVKRYIKFHPHEFREVRHEKFHPHEFREVRHEKFHPHEFREVPQKKFHPHEFREVILARLTRYVMKNFPLIKNFTFWHGFHTIQFSSQISVTLVSVLFTPPLVNPIYQQLSR